MPKTAVSIPGKGGSSRAPFTKCLSATAMRSLRPGSESPRGELVLLESDDMVDMMPLAAPSGQLEARPL
jgi:hypothetical protein